MRVRRVRTQFLAGALCLAAVAAAWLVSPAAVAGPLGWLSADPLRFGAALVALALVRPLFLWPTTLLAVAGGYGYGVVGILAALPLIVLTSVPPFLLARHLRAGAPVSTAGARLADAADAAGDVRSVTASRLLPAPSDVVSTAAGLADVRLGAFVVGTALGETPWAVAGVLAGASAASLDATTLSGVFEWRLVAATALGALLLVAGPAYRYAAGETIDVGV